MRFLERVTFVFKGIFHPEGGGIWTNRGQKMYGKFNFLQNGASRAQLAQKPTELQLVCDWHRLSITRNVHFMKIATF